MAPVAPEIMPGRPPNMAVMAPIKKALNSPTRGSSPATNANAIASGISIRETVIPDKTSLLMDEALIGLSRKERLSAEGISWSRAEFSLHVFCDTLFVFF